MDDYAAARSRSKAAARTKSIATYLLLVLWALLVLFPFYWMVLTSVKDYGEYNSEYIPKFYTLHPTLKNYADAFTAVPLGRYLLNTLLFTVITTAVMMIVITNFVTITNANLRNTFPGLILPSVMSVFYVYLLKENFEMVPDNLYLAAKVDGTSDMKYLLRVLVPICRPTMITIIILKVIECWNSYVWPRLITDDPNYYLVSNGIQEIRENGFGRENIPAMMAAVVIISLPLIVLFLIFRNKIMSGVLRGGTKG